MKDYLVKALGYNGQVRAYAVTTTATVAQAQHRHDLWATASAALGRTLTAGLMLGAMLKGEEKITIRIEGGGPVGAIIVDANAKGEVRGYVTNPQTHVELNEHGKLDVGRIVGRDGMLTVTKDIGLKEFFTSQIPLVSGEIGEDFTYYLASSEQVPSSVGVGVLVNPDHTIQAAGGFIIQMLPGVEEETVTLIEKHLSSLMPVTQMIQRGLNPEGILAQVLGEGNFQILEKMPVSFCCLCSRERLSNALVSLGHQEIQEIIETEGQAEAHCHFCNERYLFSKAELQSLCSVTKE